MMNHFYLFLWFSGLWLTLVPSCVQGSLGQSLSGSISHKIKLLLSVQLGKYKSLLPRTENVSGVPTIPSTDFLSNPSFSLTAQSSLQRFPVILLSEHFQSSMDTNWLPSCSLLILWASVSAFFTWLGQLPLVDLVLIPKTLLTFPFYHPSLCCCLCLYGFYFLLGYGHFERKL